MNDRADGLLGGFVIYPKDRTTPQADDSRVTTNREYYMVLQVSVFTTKRVTKHLRIGQHCRPTSNGCVMYT
jgi:hypothetical protein